MYSSSVFAVLAALSLAAATPVDYSLESRGNTPSKPGEIQCSGEIIGYRTVSTKALADKVNSAKKFPKDQPNGNDLGGSAVYFSDGFGDYPGGGSGVHWCVAYADSSQLKSANKIWFTEDPRLQKCTRFSDNNVNAYIGLISQNKWRPESTLRFSKLDSYLQVAVPFSMLDKMKVCGKCIPKAEAEKDKAQYKRVNWKAGAYVGSNTKTRKRGELGARADSCPLNASSSAPGPAKSSKPATTSKANATATSKAKATITTPAKATKTEAKTTKTKAKATKTKGKGGKRPRATESFDNE